MHVADTNRCRENDYVLGDMKFGGNAQVLTCGESESVHESRLTLRVFYCFFFFRTITIFYLLRYQRVHVFMLLCTYLLTFPPCTGDYSRRFRAPHVLSVGPRPCTFVPFDRARETARVPLEP